MSDAAATLIGRDPSPYRADHSSKKKGSLSLWRKLCEKMKKTTKKIFSILLSLAMLMSLLVGCGVHGNGEDTTGDPGSETSGGGASSTTDDGRPVLPDTEVGHLLGAFVDAAYASGAGLTSLDENGKKLAAAWSEAAADAENVMNSALANYTSGSLSYEKAAALFRSFMLIDGARATAEALLQKTDAIAAAAESTKAMSDYISRGKYMQASREAAALPADSTEARSAAGAMIGSHIDDFKAGVSSAVTEYMVRYKIADGKSYLAGLRGLGIDDHIAAEEARLEAYRVSQEDDLEKVTVSQTLENIYTHCMIAFPEINFASASTYRNCGDDCLTYHEFTYLLNSLYEKGYILIDANSLYDAESGKAVKSMMLPRGKKPLILTFDDVTYDSRKQGRGMVDKIILDEDGYICTYTKMADGTEVISYDNEHFPVLDAFVREHPDFTFHGARGTIFFTGFDGILGYRTQSEPLTDAEAALGLDRNAEIAEARRIVAAMKEEGWTFGSHSYNHRHMTRLSAANFKLDTDMWEAEVGSIVGPTQLFCWPYGDHTDANYNANLRKGELHKYLYDKGFRIFFGCGSARYVASEPDGLGIFTNRKGVTGNVLYYIEMEYKSYLRDYLYLIDPEKMWDPLRLPYKYMPPYKA